MKKYRMYKILGVIFILLFLSCIHTVSQAASFGSVDGINDSLYPGFKSQLKQLQKTYPNITVLYTDLDWNTVINNEHKYVHGRNLVPISSSDVWICQECKNSGKKYDSGLYCASEEAVRYVMDPRNYLNTKDIFQFQKLNKDMGTTTSEISKILQIEQVNYLKNDADAINAFVQAAKNNNLNAYHLVTRVIQEQGRSGTTALSSGLGYTGNGLTNYGYGFYNLFSIGATRNSSDPVYKIYTNALDRAAIEGWNTRAKSISGGGKFVGNTYIDVGQNTLYLQKFSVYDNGKLYWHQYMQNLFGAQNEAKIMYSLYQTTGIQNNRNFEFVVPVYKNMPKQNSKMPGAQYDGYMTSSQYGNIQKEGNKITGHLVVQEWLKDANGINSIQAEPTMTPRIVLKSDDGTYVSCEVTRTEPYVYKYSIDVNYLSLTKEYYIEAQCANSNNISNHKIITRIPHKNQDLGKIGSYYTQMLNNVFTFRYDGYLTTSPFSYMSLNGSKVEGLLVIQEWLDGTKQIQPTAMPKVYLVADDGSKVQCEVGYVQPYVYGFSSQEKYINKAKDYKIQVESGTWKNISTHNKVQLQHSNRTLGIWGIHYVQIVNHKLNFRYHGYMTSSPYSQISLNGTKISGRLVVQEWLNGTKQMEPTSQPKLVIKNSNNAVVTQVGLRYVEPYVYSYEMDISSLARGNYTFEVQGTNPTNVSANQKITVAYSNQNIGNIGNDAIKIENGKLTRKEKNDKYDGYMLSSPFNQNITLAGNKMSGSLIVQEWLNGITQMEPKTLPKLVVKNSSNSVVMQVTLKYIQPYLYNYDIDLSKLSVGTYTLEVQGTNPNNISNHQNIVIQYNNREIGSIGNDQIKMQNGKLVRQAKNTKYDGYMLSKPYDENVTLKGTKMTGKLIVQEWLNGTKQMEPITLPKLVIKNSTGTVVAQTTMKKEIPYLYSYEIDVATLTAGTYTLEVQGTNPNNTSSHQKIEIQYKNKQIGMMGQNTLTINTGKIVVTAKK